MTMPSPAPATPVLPALIHPLTRRILHDHQPLVRELVHGLGSPLHLLLPQVFATTAMNFMGAMRGSGVDGSVMYAKKANKGQSFVERCPGLGLGVDAASVAEVTQSLAAGVPGPLIGISGPAKHSELLRLALWQGCLVAIDSVDELRAFASLAAQHGRTGRVLLRWRPDSQQRSRFGLHGHEMTDALRTCVEQQTHLKLEGFSFHLSGYSAPERAQAAHRLVDFCLEARHLSLGPDRIDIGGGFAIRYVEPSVWRDFMAQQQPGHYHAGKSFGGGFYPYGSESHGPALLADVLATPGAHEQQPLANRLQAHGIGLLIEPGRALLDQAGFSVFRVQGIKDRVDEGYGIVTVDGTSFSMSEQWFDSEYLPDPLLLSHHAAPADAKPYEACVAGASCLDSDMVTWRKIRLPQRPQVGDLLAYVNTAGYQMDSNESPFHELPLPRKVAMNFDERGALTWRLDTVAPVAPSLSSNRE